MPLPPLSSPAAELTPEERERYGRQILLPAIGVTGQRRLKNARVLVLGAGGLGSPVLLYLAAAGVGTIGILDDDLVETANLHRQVVHNNDAVGAPKTASAARSVRDLNPLVKVAAHPERLDEDNASRIFEGYDVIVDGLDTFDSRYLASDTATALGKPHVWGSVLGFDGQVSVFWSAAPGGGIALRDLYPERPVDADVDSCSTVGVFGPLCASVGGVMASETIKLLVGAGEVALGRVLVTDALDASWREIPLLPAAPKTQPLNLGRTQTDLGVSAEALDEPGTIVIDLREEHEYVTGTLPDALAIPFGTFVRGARPEGIERDARVILSCATDRRSSLAARILHDEGWTNVSYLRGGFDALTP